MSSGGALCGVNWKVINGVRVSARIRGFRKKRKGEKTGSTSVLLRLKLAFLLALGSWSCLYLARQDLFFLPSFLSFFFSFSLSLPPFFQGYGSWLYRDTFELSSSRDISPLKKLSRFPLLRPPLFHLPCSMLFAGGQLKLRILVSREEKVFSCNFSTGENTGRIVL